MTANSPAAGELVRTWRQQRNLSQLALAAEAEISQKHLSFIESGRSAPSREMVLHLAERLDMPLRERNILLLAAGYAPLFKNRSLADPALERAKAAIDIVLKAHEPYPALTIDRHWTLVSANAGVAPLLSGVDPDLLKPPLNVMRVSLHPRGLAPLIVNIEQWRDHLLDRLRRQHNLTRDPAIETLLREVSGYRVAARRAYDPSPVPRPSAARSDDIMIPLQLRTQRGLLSLISTITVFGTPLEITLSELSVEAFFPADAATADILRSMQRNAG
jgi:transcriptional regulator with XRE-family HTH domain